jgi:hypothetical protein
VLPGRRSIASQDAASGGFQWDGRFTVTFCEWVPIADAAFYVYGGGSYGRPRAVPLRQLSPTKHAKAQYFAVLEYTLYHEWYAHVTITAPGGKTHERKSLPSRLEQRLKLCLERFNATDGNERTDDILQVVSVVGVVSQVHHAEAIGALLSARDCTLPLLAAMFRARRFVHFFKAPMIPQAAAISLAPAGGGEAPA